MGWLRKTEEEKKEEEKRKKEQEREHDEEIKKHKKEIQKRYKHRIGKRVILKNRMKGTVVGINAMTYGDYVHSYIIRVRGINYIIYSGDIVGKEEGWGED